MIERVGGHVERELGRFGAAGGLAPIVDAWPAAVGPDIARNAWPARVARDGTLHVNTASSAWAFELGQLEPRIRESLGELAPRRLRFVVGPVPEAVVGEQDHGRTTGIEPSRKHAVAANEIAAEIDDENLRKIVAKAAALSLAKADSDR